MAKIIKHLKDFIGIHKDSKIIVCGCGISLLDFKEHAHKYITIGVNDVPILFTPTYLLVTDSPRRFGGKRKDRVNKAESKYLFTCAAGWRHPNLVHFKLEDNSKNDVTSPDKICHFVHSPYVAVGLAARLGAKHIGLIGVDFTKGHFYNKNDGEHPVIKMNYLKKVNSVYSKMQIALNNTGTQIYNLSSISKIELPKITLSAFDNL